MTRISLLKLDIVLLIIRDSNPTNLIRKLSHYTLSRPMQVMYILEQVENLKFIAFSNGEYVITNDGLSYLQSRNLLTIDIDELKEKPRFINEEILNTYVPNRI